MSEIDCFRRTVFEVSQLLSLQDLGAIAYLYKLPDAYKDMSCQLQVLYDLERRGVFSSSSPEGLKTLLATIHRSDLSEIVSKYMAENKRNKDNEESDCFYKRVKTMMKTCNLKLCIAQACHLVKQLLDIQQKLAGYSNTHRTTPADDQFHSDMDNTLAQLRNEVGQYVIEPLKDFQRSLQRETSASCTQKSLGVCMQRETSASCTQNRLEARKPNDCHVPKIQTMSQILDKIPSPNTNSKTDEQPVFGQLTHASSPEVRSHSDGVGIDRIRLLESDDSNDYDVLEPKDSETIRHSQRRADCQVAMPGSIDGTNKKAMPGSIDGINKKAMPGSIDGTNKKAMPGSIDGTNKKAMPGSIDGTNKKAMPGSIDGTNKKAMPGSIDGTNKKAIPLESNQMPQYCVPSSMRGTSVSIPRLKQYSKVETFSSSYPTSPTYITARNTGPNSRFMPTSLPGSPSRRHMSPSNSPLVQWSSVLGRNSQSSDCWDYSLTCSEDDSGFADIRELHKQLDHSLLVSEKGHPGSTDKPVYAALDAARTDAYNDYVQPQPRNRN